VAETWTGAGTGLCRVRVGIDNPEQQPIFNDNKTKCIVMFGECLDYADQKKELLSRGHVFAHCDNDAEFCLKLYEEYGEAAFAMLNGSYCLAIYDITRGELMLVSDRLGTRPLFYGSTPDGKLIFATQVASVLCIPEISRELNIAAITEFCTLQRVVGDKTYHQGVKMLPPASALRYHAGRVVISAYWQLDYQPQTASADEYAEELVAVMKRSARNLMRGGARVGMLLSGGLDARMVVAAVEDKITCFTFGDYLNPEAEAARRIARARGFEFHFLQRDPDDYVNIIDTAVDLGNGMHPFNHAHATTFLNIIGQQCDVITHGYVPELLFRGTSLPKIENKVMGLKAGKRLDPTLSEVNLPQRLFRRGYSQLDKGAPELFTAEGKAILEKTLSTSAREIIAQASVHSRNIYDQFLWPDVYYHARYPSMLFETSLRAFMTERSLFFNNGVIDLHLKMPVRMRADNRVWIKALARLNKKIAKATDANTGHSPYMPALLDSILESGNELSWRFPLLWRLRKRSAGESVQLGLSPISWPRFDWMIRSNPKMRQAIADTLSDPKALPPAIFDHKKINGVLTDHLAGRGHHRIILFALLTFGRWHKKYANH
jgi:asparagine synthase (glutamine-hydrolysing)